MNCPFRLHIRGLLLAFSAVCLFLNVLRMGAAEAPSYDQQYTKREYRIPMRDGIQLFTVVYSPKERSTTYPILLQRTPYSLKPYTVDAGRQPAGFPESYLKEKFILVRQDVRGQFASEGEFVDVRPHNPKKSGSRDTDESTDAYDTIDWLLKKVPNHNGNVGLQGISYPGFFAAAGMIDSHPALKAVSPQAPVADMFDGDDVLHGGGFWLIHNFGFFQSFDQKLADPTRQSPRPFDFKTPDGYAFFLQAGSLSQISGEYFENGRGAWQKLMATAQNAESSKRHDITPHLKNVQAAVMTVGGWFDAEDLSGTLKTYRATEKQNPGIFNTLVMGPWSHGGWHSGDGQAIGPVQFHAKTSEFFRDQIEIPFFRRFLKGATNVNLPEAYVFETGTGEWRRESEWPPKNAPTRELFFDAGRSLKFERPPENAMAFDEYVSDPARPVPFTSRITTSMPAEYMVEDQRFAAMRPDVLTYQTEPLKEDLTVAGPITVSLHVSTSGTDADWIVKVIDVYTGDHPDPDPNPRQLRMGHYQQLVRGEPFRGKFRKGYDKPEAFEPGVVTPVEWTMPDICHTFRSGHRIMIQVQSTWFPLLDRNPQTFCNIYSASPDVFQKATHRVHRSGSTPSFVRLHIVSPDQ